MMQVFEPYLDVLQEAILSHEYLKTISTPCECKSSPARFRCRDCFQCAALCQSCIVSAHRLLPFHHVEVWSGTHFVRKPLESLGFVLQLGHHGHRCENASDNKHSLTVVHCNGIHEVAVRYCHCFDKPSHVQLTEAGLFPATITRPCTAFTFDLLRDYHLHSTTSKLSAQDYFRSIQRHTDNVLTHQVPVRQSY